MIIKEKDFLDKMVNVVEPFLASHINERFLHPDEDHTIYYASYSIEDAKGVIIISHGCSECADKYKELIYYFLNMGLDVYVPDHLGHGRSSRLVEDPSVIHVDHYESYCNDLLALAHLARSENPSLPLYLYGHSMGGGIAACAAAKEPTLFEKLILSSPMVRPQTGSIPWHVAKNIARINSLRGKGTECIPGLHPYDCHDSFDESASTSEPRFTHFNEQRENTPEFQTTSASYHWLSEVANMSDYLLKTGWKSIQIPTLLFQAENDDCVCLQAQEEFARQIHKQTPGLIKLIKVPDAKHEIYNSTDDTLPHYISRIARFINE